MSNEELAAKLEDDELITLAMIKEAARRLRKIKS